MPNQSKNQAGETLEQLVIDSVSFQKIQITTAGAILLDGEPGK
jgi:hypothetical protein